jgi:hypothetical protein
VHWAGTSLITEGIASPSGRGEGRLAPQTLDADLAVGNPTAHATTRADFDILFGPPTKLLVRIGVDELERRAA